jgi:hypothetical protein
MTVAKPENSSLNAIVLAGGDGTKAHLPDSQDHRSGDAETVVPNYWNGNALRPN